MLVKLADVIDEIGYQALKAVYHSDSNSFGEIHRAHQRSARLKAIALLLGDDSVSYSYHDRMNNEEFNDLPF